MVHYINHVKVVLFHVVWLLNFSVNETKNCILIFIENIVTTEFLDRLDSIINETEKDEMTQKYV